MNLLELQRKLVAAARSNPPREDVPYAFEQRIMARITGQHAVDPWNFWARALSRSAILCVAIMLMFSAWSLYLPHANQDSLSQEVDNALFAAVDNASPDSAGDTW
jgi:hypothetical protein